MSCQALHYSPRTGHSLGNLRGQFLRGEGDTGYCTVLPLAKLLRVAQLQLREAGGAYVDQRAEVTENRRESMAKLVTCCITGEQVLVENPAGTVLI